MEFKKDDIVYCIDNKINDILVIGVLKKDTPYTVDSDIKNEYERVYGVRLKEISGMGFNLNRFIPINEYRKNKIQKIKNGIQKR